LAQAWRTEVLIRIGVPRTEEEEHALLGLRPPGWEYLLFAGVLVRGRDALESKWHEEEIRYVRLNGPLLSDREAPDVIVAAFGDLNVYVENAVKVLEPHNRELAFGPRGTAGNPQRIVDLGTGVVATYESILDWAAHVRGARTSARFRHLFELAAALADQPLADFRAFFDRVATEFDQIPELIAHPSGKPTVLDLTLAVHLDDRAVSDYSREVERLKKEGGVPK
jgi:hypothetical protein